MTDGSCKRCGRTVALRGQEQLCSNCYAIANAACCAGCGEHRRVDGRDPQGRPWCERCRNRLRAESADSGQRQLIVEVVTAADGSLSEATVRQTLDSTVATRRSLRRLAELLCAHPDVFVVGPTSLSPVLDRFTEALMTAGAATITTIHPVCDGCGRRRRRHFATGDGGLCTACRARQDKRPCAACGRTRHVVARDRDGRGWCAGCLGRRRRDDHLDGLTEQIVAALAGTVSSLSGAQVAAAIEKTAPNLPIRVALAEAVRCGPPLEVPGRRPAVVARLLDHLRSGGVVVAPAACTDCDQAAEPLVVHGGEVRCAACERRRERAYRRGSDTEAADIIVQAVITADSSLTDAVVRKVLTDVVPSERALPLLAARIATDPKVLTVGPTTTMAALDRFTTALADAGAAAIRPIHPFCDGCGERRRRQTRTATGGLCSSCSRRGPCAICGRVGSIAKLDDAGVAVCRSCEGKRQRDRRLDDLGDQIAAAVIQAQPSLDRPAVMAAIDAAAPTVTARAALVDQLPSDSTLATPDLRHHLLARLLDQLHAGGADLPLSSCANCDQPAEPLFIHRGIVRCRHCATRCPDCAHPRARPATGKCRWCHAATPAPRCIGCGRSPRGGLGDDGRCRRCRWQAEHHCERCETTTGLTRRPGGWICQPCALEIDLDECLGPPDRLPAALSPLRAAIASADNPAGVRRWLRSTTGGHLLGRLASGEVPLTHDTLDDVGADRSIDHLRALLVGSGALPDEDRSLDRLEQFFDCYLDTRIADPADRKVVRAWLRWQVLPRLRKRADSGASMAHSANNARRALHAVTELLDGLAGHGRNLHTATQADLDNWFAHPSAQRWLTRPFLAWARQRNHLERRFQLPPTPAQPAQPALDDPGRWATARRLVADDTLAVDDRIAGALVVLYGQPLARITQLTTNDIHPGGGGAVTINLDGHTMPIHEPFANLIGQLPLRRSNGVTDQIASTWLFPGGHAGKHINPVVLGHRLRAIGIEPRNMRNSARAQLVAEIPAAVLGNLIGISPSTASRWATLTNTNWTAYAASRTPSDYRAHTGETNPG